MRTVAMRVRPIEALYGSFVLLSLLPIYLVVWTSMGNYWHGGGPYEAMLLDALVVFGAYGCLEAVRRSQLPPTRIAAVLIGVPLVALAVLELAYAAKYFFHVLTR